MPRVPSTPRTPPILHVIIPVGPFRSAFAKAAAVAPSKSPKPVLSNVKLVADDAESATLSSTDLEIGLSVPIPSTNVLHPGSCLLPTRIGTALASLPADAMLDISVDGAKIHLSTKGWKCAIVSDDPDLFPTVPGADTGSPFAIVIGKLLKMAIQRTSYAQDPNSTRYALGGSLVEQDAEKATINVVATDGRRLVRQTIPAMFDEVTPLAVGTLDSTNQRVSYPVMSKRFLDLVAKLIEPDAVVGLRVDSNRAALATQQGWTLYGRLVEGRFPAWRDVFSDDVPAIKANVNTAEFVAAVQRVAGIACSEESRGIDVAFLSDGLHLSGQSADHGMSNDWVAVEYEGDAPQGEVGATIDHQYLAEMLKGAAPDVMRFDLISHKHPVIGVGDDGAMMACLMPLTRDR